MTISDPSQELAVRLAWAVNVLAEVRQGELGPASPELTFLPPIAGTPMANLAVALALEPSQMATLWLLASLQLLPAAWRAGRELAGDETGLPRILLRAALQRCGLTMMGSEFDELINLALVDESSRAGAARMGATQRVIDLCLGELRLDPLLSPVVTAEVESSTSDALPTLPSLHDPRQLIVVTGRRGLGRTRAIASAILAASRLPLVVDSSCLPQDEAELAMFARRLARECRLFAATPVVVEAPGTDIGERLLIMLARLVPATICYVAAAGPAPMRGRDVWRMHLDDPTPTQRAAAFSAAVPGLRDDDAQLLAHEFAITPAVIAAVGRRVAALPMGPDEMLEAVADAVLDQCSDAVARLAPLRTDTHRLADVVLPQSEREEIEALIQRLLHRRIVLGDWQLAHLCGRQTGAAALLSGPPGTGKTMVAGAIANELGYKLHQVDVSRVVSKYIGETERNLAELFDAADGGGVALLFDEADSLFGRRTEVKSSNDRNANMETNFMLQRLEAFSGLVLLTTNHEDALDPAIMRRLATHVRVPLPDATHRHRLWKFMLRSVPVDDSVDLSRLARDYVMSGGLIRNAVLRASYTAASGPGIIDGALLEDAASRELEAAGRLTLRTSRL